MKTSKNVSALILVVQIFLSGFAVAQEKLAHVALQSNEPVAEPNYTAVQAQPIALDEQGQTIKVNYTVPAFTYSAVLLVQDFTGRTLRSINLNPHTKISAEISVNDLLAGTYTYVMVLDNQKKISGEFTISE